MGVVVMAGVAALDYLRKGTGYIQGVQQKVDASSALNMVFNSPSLCENSFFRYQAATSSNGAPSRVLVSAGTEFVPTMEMLSPADREALQAEVGRANPNPLFAGLESDPIRVGVGMQPFRMTQASQTAFESTRTARNARPAPAASPTSTSAPAVLANLDMIRLGSSVAPVVIEVGGRFSGSTVTSLTIRPLPVAAVSVAPQEFFGWTANEKVSVGYAELDIRFENSQGGITLAPIKKTFQYAVGVVSRRLRACSLNGGLLANPVFASEEVARTPASPAPVPNTGGQSRVGPLLQLTGPYVETTATEDGILTVTSGWNGDIALNIRENCQGDPQGVEVVFVHKRDRYGQGYNSFTFPIRQGDCYRIRGSVSKAYFRSIQ
jgi:hypothetical protein